MSDRFETIDDLWVCSDCVMFLANGDFPEYRDETMYADCIDAIWPPEEGWSLCVDFPRDGEEEDTCYNEFSWSSCDCCGSTLGGSRYRATAIRETRS